MANLSLSGLGSNLDVSTIVSQLMTVERRPLDLLATQAQKTQTKLSAFGQLKSLLSTFQNAMDGIGSAKFSSLKAIIADGTLASVTATAKAAEGRHTLEVQTLAEAQKLATPAFTTTTDAVGTGTLTFHFGSFDGTTFTDSKPVKTVTIGAGQNTVAGVRDAINAAGIGVTASLVNDGTGPRLVVTSNDTGTKNTLKVTVADDDGTPTDASGLSRLAYDPAAAAGSGRNLTQTVAAVDATFKLDGMQVTSQSNTVSDALEGVTLNLLKGAPGTTTTITVARDSSGAQGAVATFVQAWNDMRNTLSALTAYDASTKKAGTLQGDSIALGIESGMRRVLNAVPPGLTGSYTTLSQVGVTMKKDGTLVFDVTKFQSALAKSPDSVAALFGTTARASDARVTVSGYTDATTAASHAIEVTQAATKGTLTGSAPAALDIVAGVNDSLTLLVNGNTTTVTLGAGTYASADALAKAVEAQLNGSPPLLAAGLQVQVSASGGVLAVQSLTYGSASTVAGASGNAAISLFGGAPVSAAGVDLAGTIDGGAATGNGQELIGASGTAAEGLRVAIAATAPGAYGSVTVSRGLAELLSNAAAGYTGTQGGIGGRVDGLNAQLKVNQKRQDEWTNRLTDIEARLKKQFTALDNLLSKMNQTSAYLTQQLDNLPKITGTGNSN